MENKLPQKFIRMRGKGNGKLINDIVAGCFQRGNDKFLVHSGLNIIGRNQCHIEIANVALSSKHALIYVQNSENHFVSDLKSTNGTKLNDQLIADNIFCPLNDGDRLAFGDYEVVYSKFKVTNDVSYCENVSNIFENSENDVQIPETPRTNRASKQSFNPIVIDESIESRASVSFLEESVYKELDGDQNVDENRIEKTAYNLDSSNLKTSFAGEESHSNKCVDVLKPNCVEALQISNENTEVVQNLNILLNDSLENAIIQDCDVPVSKMYAGEPRKSPYSDTEAETQIFTQKPVACEEDSFSCAETQQCDETMSSVYAGAPKKSTSSDTEAETIPVPENVEKNVSNSEKACKSKSEDSDESFSCAETQHCDETMSIVHAGPPRKSTSLDTEAETIPVPENDVSNSEKAHKSKSEDSDESFSCAETQHCDETMSIVHAGPPRKSTSLDTEAETIPVPENDVSNSEKAHKSKSEDSDESFSCAETQHCDETMSIVHAGPPRKSTSLDTEAETIPVPENDVSNSEKAHKSKSEDSDESFSCAETQQCDETMSIVHAGPPRKSTSSDTEAETIPVPENDVSNSEKAHKLKSEDSDESFSCAETQHCDEMMSIVYAGPPRKSTSLDTEAETIPVPENVEKNVSNSEKAHKSKSEDLDESFSCAETQHCDETMSIVHAGPPRKSASLDTEAETIPVPENDVSNSEKAHKLKSEDSDESFSCAETQQCDETMSILYAGPPRKSTSSDTKAETIPVPENVENNVFNSEKAHMSKSEDLDESFSCAETQQCDETMSIVYVGPPRKSTSLDTEAETIPVPENDVSNSEKAHKSKRDDSDESFSCAETQQCDETMSIVYVGPPRKSTSLDTEAETIPVQENDVSNSEKGHKSKREDLDESFSCAETQQCDETMSSVYAGPPRKSTSLDTEAETVPVTPETAPNLINTDEASFSCAETQMCDVTISKVYAGAPTKSAFINSPSQGHVDHCLPNASKEVFDGQKIEINFEQEPSINSEASFQLFLEDTYSFEKPDVSGNDTMRFGGMASTSIKNNDASSSPVEVFKKKSPDLDCSRRKIMVDDDEGSSSDDQSLLTSKESCFVENEHQPQLNGNEDTGNQASNDKSCINDLGLTKLGQICQEQSLGEKHSDDDEEFSIAATQMFPRKLPVKVCTRKPINQQHNSDTARQESNTNEQKTANETSEEQQRGETSPKQPVEGKMIADDDEEFSIAATQMFPRKLPVKVCTRKPINQQHNSDTARQESNTNEETANETSEEQQRGETSPKQPVEGKMIADDDEEFSIAATQMFPRKLPVKVCTRKPINQQHNSDTARQESNTNEETANETSEEQQRGETSPKQPVEGKMIADDDEEFSIAATQMFPRKLPVKVCTRKPINQQHNLDSTRHESKVIDADEESSSADESLLTSKETCFIEHEYQPPFSRNEDTGDQSRDQSSRDKSCINLGETKFGQIHQNQSLEVKPSENADNEEDLSIAATQMFPRTLPVTVCTRKPINQLTNCTRKKFKGDDQGEGSNTDDDSLLESQETCFVENGCQVNQFGGNNNTLDHTSSGVKLGPNCLNQPFEEKGGANDDEEFSIAPTQKFPRKLPDKVCTRKPVNSPSSSECVKKMSELDDAESKRSSTHGESANQISDEQKMGETGPKQHLKVESDDDEFNIAATQMFPRKLPNKVCSRKPVNQPNINNCTRNKLRLDNSDEESSSTDDESSLLQPKKTSTVKNEHQKFPRKKGTSSDKSSSNVLVEEKFDQLCLVRKEKSNLDDEKSNVPTTSSFHRKFPIKVYTRKPKPLINEKVHDSSSTDEDLIPLARIKHTINSNEQSKNLKASDDNSSNSPPTSSKQPCVENYVDGSSTDEDFPSTLKKTDQLGNDVSNHRISSEKIDKGMQKISKRSFPLKESHLVVSSVKDSNSQSSKFQDVSCDSDDDMSLLPSQEILNSNPEDRNVSIEEDRTLVLVKSKKNFEKYEKTIIPSAVKNSTDKILHDDITIDTTLVSTRISPCSNIKPKNDVSFTETVNDIQNFISENETFVASTPLKREIQIEDKVLLDLKNDLMTQPTNNSDSNSVASKNKVSHSSERDIEAEDRALLDLKNYLMTQPANNSDAYSVASKNKVSHSSERDIEAEDRVLLELKNDLMTQPVNNSDANSVASRNKVLHSSKRDIEAEDRALLDLKNDLMTQPANNSDANSVASKNKVSHSSERDIETENRVLLDLKNYLMTQPSNNSDAYSVASKNKVSHSSERDIEAEDRVLLDLKNDLMTQPANNSDAYSVASRNKVLHSSKRDIEAEDRVLLELKNDLMTQPANNSDAYSVASRNKVLHSSKRDIEAEDRVLLDLKNDLMTQPSNNSDANSVASRNKLSHALKRENEVEDRGLLELRNELMTQPSSDTITANNQPPSHVELASEMSHVSPPCVPERKRKCVPSWKVKENMDLSTSRNHSRRLKIKTPPPLTLDKPTDGIDRNERKNSNANRKKAPVNPVSTIEDEVVHNEDATIRKTASKSETVEENNSNSLPCRKVGRRKNKVNTVETTVTSSNNDESISKDPPSETLSNAPTSSPATDSPLQQRRLRRRNVVNDTKDIIPSFSEKIELRNTRSGTAESKTQISLTKSEGKRGRKKAEVKVEDDLIIEGKGSSLELKTHQIEKNNRPSRTTKRKVVGDSGHSSLTELKYPKLDFKTPAAIDKKSTKRKPTKTPTSPTNKLSKYPKLDISNSGKLKSDSELVGESSITYESKPKKIEPIYQSDIVDVDDDDDDDDVKITTSSKIKVEESTSKQDTNEDMDLDIADIIKMRKRSASIRSSIVPDMSASMNNTKKCKHQKVLFTFLKDSDLRSKVVQLGGVIACSPSDCTVLVTEELKRSVKLLCVLGMGKPIVSPKWVLDSFKVQKFLDPWNYLVKDPKKQKEHNFKLKISLSKARESPFLKGFNVYVTPSVKPPPLEMKEIVQCCGGKFIERIPSKWPPKSIIVSCVNDKDIYDELKSSVNTPPIVDPEAIITGVIQQQFQYNSYLL